jgi:MATE family multidrug resistance protein
MRFAMWSTVPLMLVFTLRSLFSAMEFAKIILSTSIATPILNALFNYSFMFGHFGAPALGVRGAAIGTLLTQSVIFLTLFLYTYKNSELREIGIFTRIWRPDWEAFFEILRLGWPISTAILAEVSLFIGAAIMMGWIGIIPLAAHGIALQLATVTFMIPLGLSNGATVRVGKAFGRRDMLALERAGISVIVISIGIAAGTALLFWTFPEQLIRLFLDAGLKDTPAVIAYAIPLVYVAAAFQLVDAAQVVATGVLRGMRDTKIPMYIAVASYWLIGMPTAYFLAFILDFGGIGLWFGLALALFIAAILLNGRFALRKKYQLVPH